MAGIFTAFNAEMKAGFTDFQGVDMRRMGLRALPIAVVATAGIAGLAGRKRSQPPDPQLIQSTAIACKARSELAKDGFSSAAEMRRALREAGADTGAVSKAMQALRGPLERDLMVAEQTVAKGKGDRKTVYKELVDRWVSEGFLAEPGKKRVKYKMGLDLVTQVDESYGRDIGSQAPPCLLNEDAKDLHCLGVDGWAAASDALSTQGVVLLRSYLTPASVGALRQRLGVKVSALDAARKDDRGFSPVRQYMAEDLLDEDEDLQPVVSTPGRYHFYFRGRQQEALVRDVQAGIMPLVWEYFARAEPEAAANGEQPYISEVQLLISEPCAADQFWHLDNAARGLTVFVPLTEVSDDLGPTLFLPGTHHLFEGSQGTIGRLRRFAQSFLSSEGVAKGTMQAGDALVYDSRVLHRCAVNSRYDRTRVALVFRYDVQRPPGIGVPMTFFLSKAGTLLTGVQRLYQRLPRE